MNTRWKMAATALATAALLGACGKDETKKAETKGKKGADTASVRVVTARVEAKAFQDWGDYSSDLRGDEDAVLVTATGGRVNSVSEVGTVVKKGQALCDIEADRMKAVLSQAEVGHTLAKNEYERTKANVEAGSIARDALHAAELQVRNAEVGLLQARRAYEDSRCQAPFSGVLVSRFVDRFQTVAPGTPTVRIASTGSMDAHIAVPESESHSISAGQKAEFYLIDEPTRVYEGRIRSVDRAIEPRNRTVGARLEIRNRGNELRPGMIGRVRILKKSYDQAIVIPSTALLRLQEGTAVMIAQDRLARRVDVQVGPSSGDSILVRSGLKAGDLLITEGAFQVSEGTRVNF